MYIPAVTCICSSSMRAPRDSDQRCVACTARCTVVRLSKAATQLSQEVVLASCPSVRFERTIFFVLLRSTVVPIVPAFTFIKLPHRNNIFVVNTHPSTSLLSYLVLSTPFAGTIGDQWFFSPNDIHEIALFYSLMRLPLPIGTGIARDPLVLSDS